MTFNLINKQQKIYLLFVLVLAFSLRFSVRLIRGEESFWGHGYEYYHTLGMRLVDGETLCIDFNGPKCAYYPPLYPLVIASGILIYDGYQPIVFFQSLIGTGTVLCIFLIAKEWFGPKVALLASLMASIYPYYVWHDTSLQDTCLFVFLTTLSVLIISRSYSNLSISSAAWAGIILGVATLAKVTLIPFVIIYCISVMFLSNSTIWGRLLHSSVLLTGFLVVVAPWLVRNNILIGAPVFTSIAGRQLWVGNNHYTFNNYPEMSIDYDEIDAWEAMSQEDLASVTLLQGDELAQQNWFQKRGIEYILNHPEVTVGRAWAKVVTAFSWKFSPYKSRLLQTVYFISYFPVSVLGIVGLMISSNNWKKYLPVFALFTAFVASTAVFWAHTSHRSYLDLYMMIFAANAILVGINKARSAISL